MLVQLQPRGQMPSEDVVIVVYPWTWTPCELRTWICELRIHIQNFRNPQRHFHSPLTVRCTCHTDSNGTVLLLRVYDYNNDDNDSQPLHCGSLVPGGDHPLSPATGAVPTLLAGLYT